MAYNPTTWKSGDKVTSTKLNNIEQGIADASALDTTLAEEGKPADAKAVGDRFTTNENNLSQVAEQATAVENDLAQITTASSTDVGKILKVKTVAGEKVTSWEFGDIGIDVSKFTLGINSSDNLLYIYYDGTAIGSGIDISSGSGEGGEGDESGDTDVTVGTVAEDKTISLNTEIEAGTYTLKYEAANNSVLTDYESLCDITVE